jgi:hypothetical protein
LAIALIGILTPAGSSLRASDPENGKEGKETKPPRAMLEWAVGKEKDSNGEAEDEEEDSITTDRPDFTESPVTVGRGRIQLEAGYLFVRERGGDTLIRSHGYPDMLWRIGLFTDWFELRIFQNFLSEQTISPDGREALSGAEDMTLGVKFALVEQRGWLPAVALILQTDIPTGHGHFSADEWLPGGSFQYAWDVIPDFFTVAGNTVIGRQRGIHTFPGVGEIELSEGPPVKHSYLEVAQSISLGYILSTKLAAFTEWVGMFPHSALDPEVGPEHFLQGGFTYLVTNNFQLDIRAGFGLNRHAEDFFTGAGFAVRY